MSALRSIRSAVIPESLLAMTTATLLFQALVAATGANTPGNPHAPDPVRYVVIDLGTNFYPTAINNSNVVVGNTTSSPIISIYNNGGYANYAEIWTPGAAAKSFLPAGPDTSLGTNTYAYAINDSGVVAGAAYFTYPAPSDAPAGTPPSLTEILACSWAGGTSNPICWDGQFNNNQVPRNFDYRFYATPPNWYGSFATVITANGTVYGSVLTDGWMASVGAQFSTTSAPVVAFPAVNPGFLPGSMGSPTQVTAAAAGHVYGTGVGASDNNCYVYDSGTMTPLGTGPFVYIPGMNTNGIAVGSYEPATTGSFQPATFFNGALATNLPGTGMALAINNATTGTNNTPAPQIVGVDSTGTNALLWDHTYYDGTPTTNSVYYQKSLTAMVQQPPASPTQPPSWWAVTSANGINDNGAIIGLANFTQIPYAPVQHGVLLLPCQINLLNGDTNAADVDGKFFDGTRPTTISATASYATAGVTAFCQGGNDGIDVLGVDTPLGTGRPSSPFSGNSYTYSLMVVAKVMPSNSNVTYGWNRTYRARDITIVNTVTSSNTYWFVSAVHSSTGIPIPVNDSSLYPSGTDHTTVPNANIVISYDNPAIYLTPFAGNGASLGDYAYEKRDFIYTLTNSIGSTNIIYNQHVGTYIIAQRVALTGVMASDWIGIKNIASTTNIPDCSGVTISEIRSIVGGSNPIVLDSSVTNNY